VSAPSPRARTVNAGFWCWLAAAVLLIVGGLIAASVDLPALYRGAGVLTAVAGAGMAFLAGRARSDDRFRRAAAALSMALVVLVALLAVFGVVHILSLVGLIPLIAGTVLMNREEKT
jgi:penicillin V acylase-like amidase (Ntn superfamily)